MAYQSGQSIKGYEVIDRIGSGGFGAVYRAYQTTLGREVAIKVILPGFANQPEFIRRFETEAQLVARLEHLHIVPLYDYWRDPQGAYLVMRWLRGGSVKDALSGGPYALRSASRLVDQVASALATSHAANVVHRDLKPSNILLDEEGNAYLADFSIAKDLGRSPGEAIRNDTVAGSPDYLSPEQARSQPVTPQTDIYGLGVTLYEMLTGHLPFPGMTGVERLFKHINDPLPLIENLDPLVQEEVNAVIQQATAKNPKHRYEDVLQMAAAFRQAARIEDDGRLALVESLTLREQEILQQIMQGKSNRDIADALFVEISTVKWYIRQIYPKLGVRNRRQAIMRARDLDLLVMGEEEEVAAEGAPSISLVLPAPINPYKGLRPFETADARDFFGRENIIRQLLARLSPPQLSSGGMPAQKSMNARLPASIPADRFLAIVGPSGSGKSSLVQAGLIPALARGEIPGSDHWFIVQLTPGTRPLDELEVALLRVAANQGGSLRAQLERDQNGLLRAAEIILPKDGSELVLVIDQFEELFTLTAEEAVRQHFLDILVAAISDPRSRIRLIISLRADYYDRPLHYPQFGDLVRSHMETVLPLSAEALQAAIIRPAEQAGMTCEAGLVTRIINDVLYQPGALPLLQYALTELFEKREGRVLTLQAYESIGGVTGALARRAEELVLEQDAQGQEAIRQMFLRLVAVNEGQESFPDTRRRVLQAELTAVTADEDLVDDIIDNYAGYRLLTLDHDPASRRPTVEVAHEALLREWERLRHWIEDSRDDLYKQRRLQVLAGEWLQNGRDAGLLLDKTRLDQFAAWAATTNLALTRDEQAFLDVSLLARQDRRVEEVERRQRELQAARQLAETERLRAEAQTEAARRLRRRAVYLGGALIGAAILAVLALFAGRQSSINAQQAQNNAAIAATHEAQVLREAAAAATAGAIAEEQRQIAETQRDSAAAAAVAAANAQATAEAEAAQRATAEAAAVQEREAAEAQARLATARELSLAAINTLPVDPQLSILLAIQAVKATSEIDGFALPEAESALHEALVNLRLQDVFPGSTVETCIWCGAVRYSQDGALFAAAGPGNTAVVRETNGGGGVWVVDGHLGPVVAVAIAPDNSRLVTASEDGTAMIWELTPGNNSDVLTNPSLTLAGHSAGIAGVAFSPDGSLIATGSHDNTIKLWEAANGEEIMTLSGHEDIVHDVLYTPDGLELISAGRDGSIKIWDIAAGQERLALTGHSDQVTGLAMDAGGSRLASVSWDGTVKLWDPADGRELLSLPGDSARVYAVALSADGTLLATGGTDAVINLWDIETGEEVLTLPGHQGIVFNLAFSPDGQQLASGAGDGTTRTWDITRAGSHEWLTLDGHSWVMFGLDYSPDGSKLATAGWDGALKIWDAQTGAELETLVADEFRKMAVEFSPNGRILATAAENDTAVLWDTTTWAARHTFQGHKGTVLDIAFSPDGGQLATVAEGGEEPGLINIWNTETGTLERSWVGHDASIERVAISPDGRLLATAGTDNTAKMWDLATNALLSTMNSHESPVNSVNFSHDGTRLVTSGRDNTARVWAIEGDDVLELLTLEGHNSIIWDADFSPDDRKIATISFDGTVKLWDAATGFELLTLPGTANNGREVAFSPDGKHLAVTTSSGLVPIYVLPVEELVLLAQSRVSRNLTIEECRQYLHSDQCPAAFPQS